MKSTLFALLILTAFYGSAQDPNPNLFQTWNLNFVQASDLGTPYYVSEIQPEITPTLTILDNYEFSGEGACNTFNGVFNFPNSDTIEISDYTNTNDDCGIQIHNSFENEFFSFMQNGGFYEISQEDNGLVLTINNQIFGQAIFRNYTLNTTEFDINSIKIYPNPISNLVFIDTQNHVIKKIEIFNSVGQLSKSIVSDFKIIEVSDLSIGIYLMKISTTNGILNKKIFKY